LSLLPSVRLDAQMDTSPFGVVEGFWKPDATCDLHPGWERIIFDWSQHQPNGPNDWNTLNVDDRWLKAASQCGREVVALIKHTPAWATDGTPGAGVPRGLYLPVDDPNNVWARFVRKAAQYYASRGVYRFIIWNEPDIQPDTYGFEFEGSLDDYFQLLKVAYLAAKEGNPAARIHLAGTTYWHDVNAGRTWYMDRLLARIQQDPDAAKNDDYFDVLSLHIYFRTDTVYDLVKKAHEVSDKYGMHDKAVWIDETNAAPTDDPQWHVVRPIYQINLEQQAAFLMQAAGLGLAAGAERIAVYKLIDQQLPPGGESFGIFSPADQTPRPAYFAWKAVIRYLSDVKSATLAQTKTVDVVKLVHANGQQSVMAWSRTAQATQLSITATGEKAYLLDQDGGVTIVRPTGSVYTLSLPGATCNDTDGCAVGGPISLLTQPAGDLTVGEVLESTTTRLSFQ
jgi:hypothetical protein